MKIQHLNAFDHGGAARAAMRLHQGLQSLDIDSIFAVKQKRLTDDSIIQVPWHDERNFLAKRLDWRIERYKEKQRFGNKEITTTATDCRTPYRPKHFAALPQPEIYNLHWTSGLLDWPTGLPWLAEQAPVVWTLHDMHAFSGIWHYEPLAHEWTDGLRAWDNQVRQLKSQALLKIPSEQLTIVCPSNWLAQEAENSELLGRYPIKTIPYGLNTETFAPIAKEIAREALGIPREAKVVGFIADSQKDPRKGASLLYEALKRSDADNCLLVSVGKSQGIDTNQAKHINLDSIRSDRLLALFYSSLDLFVIPSLQDNLPNTVLEAMSCGTPVAGFDTGGIPDMVRPGQTGWLVPKGDIDALSQTIDAALSDKDQLSLLSENCRKVAVEEYSLALQARRYTELYEEMLAHRS